MRRLLQSLFSPPVLWLAKRFSSRPNRVRVHASLDRLLQLCSQPESPRICRIETTADTARIIIFSDQHKGAKNGSDDFMRAEPAYLAALDHYHTHGFHLVSLGDEEELWENALSAVRRHNSASIAAQTRFVQQNRYTKVFGNHDLYWQYDPMAPVQLKRMYGQPVRVYEAVWLQLHSSGGITPFLLTHGHQGDGQSDGNWFSAWFVSRIWAPLQAYLGINPNTPAISNRLKTTHNIFMYEWSARPGNPALITGHTHQPVFASHTLLEKLFRQLEAAREKGDTAAILQLEAAIRERSHEAQPANLQFSHLQPVYFNTGCCCFADGDITGIEIAEGQIRLIKWRPNGLKEVLEERALAGLRGE
jgi:hypothetical protein